MKMKDDILSDSLRSVCDEALVASAKCGLHSAYAELCRRHSTVAFRMALRITRSHEDAEDALQDALLKAFTHLSSFDGRSTFSTWLTRISINCALMSVRRQTTRRMSSLDDTLSGDGDRCMGMAHHAPDPERQFREQEMTALLHQAIRRLPPMLRGVIEIQHAGDLPVKDVAAQAGISVAATKSRLARARNELSAHMENHSRYPSMQARTQAM